MPYDPKAMGRVIRKLRKQRGLSQDVLSGLANIARSHLAMVECGKTAKVETLDRIATALEMPLSELFRLVEEDAEEQI